MAKLKATWMRTDIPKHIKIELWRLMKDNPTYSTWSIAIAHSDFKEEEDKYIRTSRDTYQALQAEIRAMPIEEIRTLPPDLQIWIRAVRPELSEELRIEPEDEELVIISRMWENIRRDKVERGEPYIDPFTRVGVLEF